MHCKDCQHWKQSYDKTHGTCQMSLVPPAEFNAEKTPWTILKCGPLYGCLLFKVKEETTV